jgi:hypothetical protein
MAALAFQREDQPLGGLEVEANWRNRSQRSWKNWGINLFFISISN